MKRALKKLGNGATRWLSRAPHLLRLGLLAGVIVAAAGLPVAAAGGKTLLAGTNFFNNLPRDLNEVPSGQTSYLYAADGKTLLTMFYEEYRKYIPIEEMSPYLHQALVSAEDARFYEHQGVDVKGVARAFVANRKAGEVAQGASTLTMQYVRMAKRDSATNAEDVLQATEQTANRKVREMRLAIELEKKISKKEILHRYLNTAYFGHRAYGAYAAAQIYFSKLPKDLTLVEAAMLAGLVKAPTAYDPALNDPTSAKDRRDWVLDQMAKEKYITAADAETAKKQPLKLKVTSPPNDCISIPTSANDLGFFCDYFKNWWMQQAAFGTNPGERMDKLRRGGYRIVSSIDPKLQKISRSTVVGNESDNSTYAHGMVVIQPGSGQVKAMAVNRIYSLDQSKNGQNSNPYKSEMRGNYPRTVAPLLGGGELAGYQAGSTFKMFTMLAALDAGFTLSTKYYSPGKLVSQYGGADGEASSCGGRWCPANASGAMTGTQDMRSGFGKSVNTYFVQLEQAVGAAKVVRMAEKLGLKWRSSTDIRMATQHANDWGSFTLGTADTSPLEMANAYATVAANGQYCEAIPVASISNPDGSPATYKNDKGDAVSVAMPRCRMAVSAAVAQAATDAALCPTGYGAQTGGCGGWSTASSVAGQVGRPVAGKTGTTDNDQAAWFVGYTPQLAAASFMADPDNPFNAVGGGNSMKPIDAVATLLNQGLQGQPRIGFSAPPRSIR